MIYVFKTSVKKKSEVRKLKPALSSILPAEKWNFDLDDCDRILRIDSDKETVPKIINLLSAHKIDVEELE